MQDGLRWKRVRRRLRYWLERSERNRLLWEEMEFHIESEIDELVGRGMSEPGARWMNDLVQDLYHSFRGMRRDAGFAAFTILIVRAAGCGTDGKIVHEGRVRGNVFRSACSAVEPQLLTAAVCRRPAIVGRKLILNNQPANRQTCAVSSGTKQHEWMRSCLKLI